MHISDKHLRESWIVFALSLLGSGLSAWSMNMLFGAVDFSNLNGAAIPFLLVITTAAGYMFYTTVRVGLTVASGVLERHRMMKQ